MKTWFLLAAACIGMTACVPKAVEALPYYKLTVVQGLPLDAQAVLSVQPGMSREQVALNLGAPLLQPAFRENRWDYVYEVVRGGNIKENRQLTVHFEGNQVSRIEGNALEYARQQPTQP